MNQVCPPLDYAQPWPHRSKSPPPPPPTPSTSLNRSNGQSGPDASSASGWHQDSWRRTKRRKSQVNTLIYAMGDEADDILRSFNLSADDRKKYGVIFERARFNMRRQEESESVDTFITALYSLAEHCGYGNLHDEMIRDRIVVGIRNGRLSEKLQLDSRLTLESAVTQVRQAEAVKLQQSVLRRSCHLILRWVQFTWEEADTRGSRTQVLAKTVEPQIASLNILRGVRGVADPLPMTELSVLLRMPSAGSATNEGTSRLCADLPPRWQASKPRQDSSALRTRMPSWEQFTVLMTPGRGQRP